MSVDLNHVTAENVYFDTARKAMKSSDLSERARQEFELSDRHIFLIVTWSKTNVEETFLFEIQPISQTSILPLRDTQVISQTLIQSTRRFLQLYSNAKDDENRKSVPEDERFTTSIDFFDKKYRNFGLLKCF